MELGYGGQEITSPSIGLGKCITPSIEDRLLQKKMRLEQDLKDTNAALEALQANPEILKIMVLISKVNY